MGKIKTSPPPPKEILFTRKGLAIDLDEKEFENGILITMLNNMQKEIDTLKYYRIGFYTLFAIVMLNLIFKIFWG